MPPRSRSFSRSPQPGERSTFSLFTSSRPHHASSRSIGSLDTPPPTADIHRSHSTSVSGQMALRGMQRLEARRQMEENNFLSSKARSQNLNPPVDLRALEYVSQYDDNLMCPICRCPFIDPVVLSECDHCFCRDCIRQTWSSSYTPLGPRGACPTCRTPAKLGPRSATSKILINILDDLLVQCPRFADGCTAVIKRGDVQNHISIYCGYAFQECPAENCELPIRRREAGQACQHYSVSCISCHETMYRSNLEVHWRSKCPDRRVHCDMCNDDVLFREFEEHRKETCPSISLPCPGANLGCTIRGPRAQVEVHEKSCVFATLAPVMAAQKQRMDEQEAAQKAVVKKLEVLEKGFAAMEQILYPKFNVDEDDVRADESRIPLLEVNADDRPAARPNETGTGSIPFQFPLRSPPPPTSELSRATDLPVTTPQATARHPPSGPVPYPPGPPPVDLPDPYTADFDLASPFPPPAVNGPYVSPLHHLLSMHENLRDELSRMSTALQELDGRHSMQILNENLRTREEITYLGAQVAGLSRQVHWLTSAQLQRQSRSATPGTVVAGPSSDVAGASAGVEAAVTAVSTAATALRGAARVVNVGQGMRRNLSEEGRTKL